MQTNQFTNSSKPLSYLFFVLIWNKTSYVSKIYAGNPLNLPQTLQMAGAHTFVDTFSWNFGYVVFMPKHNTKKLTAS